MANPKIDVILTTYQGETRGFLKDAIESVLQQTYKNWQLYIIDDGSTDQTLNLCKKYQSHRQVNILSKTNGGLASARNYGIEHSNSPYLCFLDDDDIFENEKLHRQAEFITNTPLFGLLYTAVTHVNKSNIPLSIVHKEAHPKLYQELFFGNCINAPSSALVPRLVFENLGVFNEQLTCCEDYDMWLRIAKEYPIYSLDTPLLRYRVHDQNMSKKLETMQKTKLYVLNKALESAPEEVLELLNPIYFEYYYSCSAQFLGCNQYEQYRQAFRKAAEFGKHSSKEKLKYYTSFSPRLFRLLHKMRKSFG